MRQQAMLLVLFLLCAPLCALAAEGDPLLSVDDLHTLKESYGAFLQELEAMLIEKELISEQERDAWRDAQMGDFYQNGGYGSILISYAPGALSYVREEEKLLQLSAQFPDGSTLCLDTMCRYTPRDNSLPGLMLTLSMADSSGVPMDVGFALSGTGGVFLKWDALEGAYVSTGTTAQSAGETVVWSDQTPAEGARNPTIGIAVLDAVTQETLCSAALTLSVDGDGYRVDEGALSAKTE